MLTVFVPGRCVTSLLTLADECETSPPYLAQFDAWGRRVDNVVRSLLRGPAPEVYFLAFIGAGYLRKDVNTRCSCGGPTLVVHG
jgi:hypothetical protein